MARQVVASDTFATNTIADYENGPGNFTTMAITGGNMQPAAANQQNAAYHEATLNDNQYSRIVIQNCGANDVVGVVVCGTPGSSVCYGGFWNRNAGRWEIDEIDASLGVTLLDSETVGFGAPTAGVDELILEREGTTLRLYSTIGGGAETLRCEVTDASIVGGQAGVACTGLGSAADAQITLLEVGNIVADGGAVNEVDLTDTLAATDASVKRRLRDRETTDSLLSTDATRVTRVRTKILSDSLLATDALSRHRVHGRLATDSLAATDLLIPERLRLRTLTDETAVTDDLISSSAKVSEVTLTDELAVTDSAVTLRVRARELSDELLATDSLTKSVEGIKFVTLTDVAEVTDEIETLRQRVRRTLSQALASDSVAPERRRARLTQDALASSDGLATRRLRMRTSSDGLALTDDLIATREGVSVYERVLTDALEVTDSTIVTSSLETPEFHVTFGIQELDVEVGLEELYVLHGVTSEV